jgi:hypothetical protein
MSQVEFEHYWPGLQTELAAEPELWAGFFTPEQIFDNVLAGYIQCWAVADDGVIQLVFFTQRYRTPAGTQILQVFWLRGQKLQEFLPLLNGVLDQAAREWECSRLEIIGRKGFERLLRPLNAQHLCSIYGRPVQSVQCH